MTDQRIQFEQEFQDLVLDALFCFILPIFRVLILTYLKKNRKRTITVLKIYCHIITGTYVEWKFD